MVSGITNQVKGIRKIRKAFQVELQAKSVVRDLDPVNDLRFLRMRSNKTEILIAPGMLDSQHFFVFWPYFHLDEDYNLIVLQTPPAE